MRVANAGMKLLLTVFDGYCVPVLPLCYERVLHIGWKFYTDISAVLTDILSVIGGGISVAFDEGYGGHD